MVLRIETELYLKRLIVGGFERVYEVGRIFRNEGMDPKHNPEFTTIELYQAYTDFHGMMDLVEEMMKTVAQKCLRQLSQIPYQGNTDRPLPLGADDDGRGGQEVFRRRLLQLAVGRGRHRLRQSSTTSSCRRCPTKGAILAEFFDAFVEDKLIQPTFIYDYPVEISPLAKRKPDEPAFTERFEYFINATEFGNAFSELNDPIDQQERFERQVAERKALDPEQPRPGRLRLCHRAGIRHAARRAALGFGVDRLVMLLTDSASIRDVLLFPTMKPTDK